MIFRPTAIDGVWLIAPERRGDDRGWFARAWCAEEFAAHGLSCHWPQGNVSRTEQCGTVRGLHWQAEPHGEIKLVRVTAGAIFDVAVDLRPGSPTRFRHVGVELSAANGCALYIPMGCAHGYQTLTDGVEISYAMGASFAPGAGRGLRYDDPALAIGWPLPVAQVSAQDRSWPTLADLRLPAFA